MSSEYEPEGWRAECWPALYLPTMLVGVPWKLAFGNALLWVEVGFVSHNLIMSLIVGMLFHALLKRLHKDDPEFLAVTFRSTKFARHFRV